jgi:hypothetical protein
MPSFTALPWWLPGEHSDVLDHADDQMWSEVKLIKFLSVGHVLTLMADDQIGIGRDGLLAY